MPPISRSGGGGGKSDSLHWPAGPWSLPRSSVFKPVANTQKKKKLSSSPLLPRGTCFYWTPTAAVDSGTASFPRRCTT